MLPRRVAIVGVGLIGGSIAAALRKQAPETAVIGLGRDEKRLEKAQKSGLLTEFGTSADVLEAADFVIVCTPVSRVVEDIRHASEHVSADAILTDAGSVKASVCDSLVDHGRFVGSHPLAGSEQSGWEHADADLYRGRTCIVTPAPDSDRTVVDCVCRFWTELGMTIVEMTPVEHDLAVAQTSHLPHIAAAAVTRQLQPKYESLVARGFRDTTRVAAGDAGMWTAIAEANAAAVLDQLDATVAELQTLRNAIARGERDEIHAWFKEAAEIRSRLT